MGFVSAFGFSELLPIPMLLSFGMGLKLIFKIVRSGKIKIISNKILFPLAAFLSVVLLSFILQVQNIGFRQTGLNHLISYFATILMYFAVPTLYMKHFKINIDDIFKYISFGTLAVSIFIIIEFITKNFSSIAFDNFIHRPSVNDYIATYSLGGVRYYRARGVAQEPGHVAMYISMFAPFVYYYFKHILIDKKKLWLSMSLVTISLVLTFSAMAFIEIALVMIVLLTYVILKKMRKGFKVKDVFVLWAFPIVAAPTLVYFLNSPNFETIRMKLSLSTLSGESRIGRWINALDLFKDRPLLGNGPGITSIIYNTGSTSFYLEVLAQAGLIGLLSILTAFLSVLLSILGFKGKLKYMYLFSFLITVIHLTVISNYWYPWMWVLFAVVTYNSGLIERKKKVLRPSITNTLKA